MKIKPFFTQLAFGLNPFQLHETEDYTLKSACGFFFTLLLFAILVLVVAGIPMLASAPRAVSQAISSFDNLTLQATPVQRAPVYLPLANPLFIVDTTKPLSAHAAGIGPQVIIGRGEMDVKVLRSNIIDYSIFADFRKNKDQVSTALALLLMLLLPSILIITYAAWAVWYLLLIVLIASLAWLNLKLVGRDIRYQNLFLMALYSSVWIVLLNALLWPLAIQTYYAQYLVWIIIFSIGIWRASGGKRGRYKQRPLQQKSKTGKGNRSFSRRDDMDDDGYIKVGGDGNDDGVD